MDWRGNRSIYIILFLFLFLQGNAQDPVKQEVDSLWWKNKTEQLDYTEDKEDFNSISPMDQNFDWIYSPFVKVIVLFIIIILLLFLLYKLFGKDLLSSDSSADIKEYKLFNEDDLEDKFNEMDLEQLLKNAEEKKQWKMAIRIQFLILLKSLINGGHIKWHKDLTNFQIVYLLKNRENRNEMQTLVKDFELVWYGDRLSSENSFSSFKKQVVAFIVLMKPSSGR